MVVEPCIWRYSDQWQYSQVEENKNTVGIPSKEKCITSRFVLIKLKEIIHDEKDRWGILSHGNTFSI